MSTKTEITPAQLRSMLYQAYAEGFRDRSSTAGTQTTQDCWRHSYARSVILPHAEKKLARKECDTDLFGRIETLPPAVQAVCEKYAYAGTDYQEHENFLSELNIHGFTFDACVDSLPANLKTLVKNADLTNGDPVIANGQRGRIINVYVTPTAEEVGTYEVELPGGTICISGHFIERD